ncbi:MAG: S41 family peptidase [Albidovulum sp.]|nr:S41 family peptidase [Albidovulum sp.]
MKPFSLAVAAGLASGIVTAVFLTGALSAQESEPKSNVYQDLDLFARTFEKIRNQYVEEVDSLELIHAALNGMLSSLDPHSAFIPPKKYDEMQVKTKGEFGGLGIEVTQEDGYVKVITPIDDTPADKAGILAGDFITHVDGESILGMTLGEAVDLLRGPVGSEVVVTIWREEESEPLEVTIIRETIKLTAARVRMEGDAIVVRITTFSGQTLVNVQDGLAKEIEEAGGIDFVNGMILDLRNNAGGLLDQAVSVADAFLDKGEIVSTRGRAKTMDDRYNAEQGDLMEGKPIIVLVNGGSASASEIVAGALQDHRRAVVVGTKSFGKGSVQTLFTIGTDENTLKEKGGLRLTTGRYYTPSGRSIQGLGISPDIIVEQLPLSEFEGEDGKKFSYSETDLRNSLENDSISEEERLQLEEEIKKREAAAELRFEDYQLAYAIDLLYGLSFAQSM